MIKPFYINITDMTLEELKAVEDKLIKAGVNRNELVCMDNIEDYENYGVDNDNETMFYYNTENYSPGLQITLDQLDAHLGLPVKFQPSDIKVLSLEFQGRTYILKED